MPLIMASTDDLAFHHVSSLLNECKSPAKTCEMVSPWSGGRLVIADEKACILTAV